MSKMEPHINTSKMTIQEVAVDAVTPYDKNPRKIPQEAIDRVAASIKGIRIQAAYSRRQGHGDHRRTYKALGRKEDLLEYICRSLIN